ncbi:MAG: hypothetical protein ACE5J4_01605 [Candidatus Aenigmatarchaeota archaeon]
MPIEITLETILIFAAFVVIVFLLYRLFKIVIKAALIGIAAFSFPWIAQFLGIPLPFPANIQTGLQFALIGIGLLLIYEFFHFIVQIIKIIIWPFKILFKRKKK